MGMPCSYESLLLRIRDCWNRSCSNWWGW